MAPVFWSSGRTAIQTDQVLADTFVTLGYLDSDELIDIQIGVTNRHLKSSRGGDTILNAIYAGTNAFISIILPEWDEVQWDAVNILPGGDDEGDLGTPGLLWSGGAIEFAFAMRIAPVQADGTVETPSSARPSYTFPRCIIDGEQDGLRIFNIGVAEKRVAMSLIGLPDGSNNIYTKAVA